jgi:hypothetical protein
LVLAVAEPAAACSSCGLGTLHRGLASFTSPGVATGPAAPANGNLPQSVWLDFSQAVPGTFDDAAARRQVRDGLTDLYRGFDIAFTLDQPAEPHTRLAYDGRGLGGLVFTGLDFRNQRADDVAVTGTNGLQNEPVARRVNYAVNVGGHEIGHTLGLRHADAFGPIGSGVPDLIAGINDTPLAELFGPTFPGPRGAVNFGQNTLSTPAIGGSLATFLAQRTNLSERSIIKLQYTAQGQPAAEAGDGVTQLDMAFLDALNTRPSGGSPYLPAKAAGAIGRIDALDDVDVYTFNAKAGELLSVEFLSSTLFHRLDTADGAVRVLDESGQPIDYYGTPAAGENGFGTSDPWLLDLVAPADGQYFVEVSTNNLRLDDATGDYELLITAFGTGRTPGDANGDGVVNLADFGILRANFGDAARFSGGDFNGDLLVNLTDFGILRANFGTDNTAAIDTWRASIPEPAGLAILGLVAVVLGRLHCNSRRGGV